MWQRHRTKLEAIGLQRIAANITNIFFFFRAELNLEPAYLFIFSF